MEQRKRFCTGCGSPLEKDDQFCGSCGHKVSRDSTEPVNTAMEAPAKAASVPAPPDQGEQLLGIIPAVSRKKGLLSMESFNIVVSDKRMVFAQMTNDLIKEEAKKVSKDGGFFKGLANSMTVGYTFYKRYFDITIEATLKETPGNFSIELAGIRKIVLTEGRRRQDQNRRVYYENGKLELETAGAKYSFNVPRNFHEAAGEVLHKTGLF